MTAGTPAASQVEESSRISSGGRGGRRVVWVAVAVVLAAVLVGGAVLGAVAIYSSHRRPKKNFEFSVAYAERRVPEHVTVDYKRGIIYVNEERHGELGGLHRLHNFERPM